MIALVAVVLLAILSLEGRMAHGQEQLPGAQLLELLQRGPVVVLQQVWQYYPVQISDWHCWPTVGLRVHG